VLTFDGSRSLTDDDYLVGENDEGVEIQRIGPFFLKQPSVEAERLSEKIRAVFRRRAFDQMEQLAKNFQPTIVLSFYVVNAGFLATYVARSLGLPHVVGVRGNDIGRNIFSIDRLAAVRLVIEGSTHVVCVNEHLRRRMLLAFPEVSKRASVIMNSVEMPSGLPPQGSRNYLSTKLDWPASDPVAVFIGTPREKKGITLLLHAVEIARNQVPLRLLIVGPGLGGVERRQCGERWERLAASKVLHATGQISRTDALRIAAEGDIVVMPSIEDGLANGLLEGMALGLCPVVSDLFADVVPDGEIGWVAVRNNAAKFAEALVKAVNALGQRSRYKAAAQARIAEHHVPRREAEAYIRLFTSLIA
jgi:glycosyltransferase involved in cell wall biosynthesis